MASRSNMAPGQSGFISESEGPDPHFADQWALYAGFEHKDMVFTHTTPLWPPNHRYHRIDAGDYADASPPEDVRVAEVDPAGSDESTD